MKKGLLTSYFDGIRDHDNGEGYGTIVRYFLPEFVTALALYSLLYLLDAWFIAHLKSTSMYATLGVTNTLLHFIVKIAEGLSVGTIVLTGIHNGAGRLEQAGRSFIDAFWVTLLSGAGISALLYVGAPWIYYVYGVPQDMITLGVPFFASPCYRHFFHVYLLCFYRLFARH